MSATPTLTTIGFIGGGNMCNAMIGGLLAKSVYPSDKIYVSDPTQEQLDNLKAKYNINVNSSNEWVADNAAVIVLAVKPHLVPVVLSHLSLKPHHVIISICAGVTISSIKQHVGNIPVIRVMPNTPALVGKGTSGLAYCTDAKGSDIINSVTIMESIGLVMTVKESDLDAVTGVSGSGPAYVLMFIEALAAGGVQNGLPYPLALKLATETVYGTAAMVRETGTNPALLREQVCSPGGTTIAGVAALEDGAFRSTVMKCVSAASNRSRELSKQ